MVMGKLDKATAKKIREGQIGTGKVIIKRDPVQVVGGWEIVTEDENGKTDLLLFKTYQEAQEACFQFGGNNIMTIAAPMELNEFENWSSKKLFDLGHHVKQVSLTQSIFTGDRQRKIPNELPKDCGCGKLPGSNKKTPTFFHEMVISENYVLKKTIYFEQPEQLDNLQEWLIKKFPGHRFMVDSFVTQNHETSDYCKFTRQKVGDGTKRMELKLVKLNGEDYQKCRINNIIAAADGLASHECKIVRLETQKIAVNTICGDYLGL